MTAQLSLAGYEAPVVELNPPGVNVSLVPPDLSLRSYQQSARAGVARVHASARGGLVVLPTGMGKTRIAGAVAWDHKVAGSKVLVLCPTIVLCQQMHLDMRKLGLRSDIEQAENHVQRMGRTPLADVVVASVATMRGRRLQSFPFDTFGLVITDEAHRSIGNQYRAIYEHFSAAKLLGLTATPDRVDGVSLGNVYDQVAYGEMTMLRGISEGWLVPLRFKTAVTDFDPTHIRTVAGEVDAGSVAEELVRSGALHQAANTLAELAGDERTVAFLPTVAASKAFVAELLARKVSACHIDGTTTQETREDAFARFVAGDIRVLANVGVLTEGWDCPAASVIALLNPTKSRSRLTQMIGRGTRLAPGKTSTLVIDFCPGRLKKGRLASPADALAGKMLSDDEYANLASEGDLAAEIANAEMKAAELEAKRAKAKARAEARKARLAQMAKLSTKQQFDYATEEHSAEDLLSAERRAAAVEDARRFRGLWSTKQENMIRRLGFRGDAMDRFTASSIVGEVFARKSAGLGWGVSPETRAKMDAYRLPTMELP